MPQNPQTNNNFTPEDINDDYQPQATVANAQSPNSSNQSVRPVSVDNPSNQPYPNGNPNFYNPNPSTNQNNNYQPNYGNYPNQNNGYNYQNPVPQQPYQSNQYFQTPTDPYAVQNPNIPNQAKVPNPQVAKLLKLFQQTKTFCIQKWWLILILLVGLSVMFLGIFAYVNSRKNATQSAVEYTNVNTQISAPATLAQGTPGTWEITIENKEKVPITNVILDLKFDNDFQFLREITPSSENGDGLKYILPKIDALGGRTNSIKIRFEGILIGRPDIETTMSGKITYQPEVNSKLQNTASLDLKQSRTKITSPEIDLSLTPTIDEVRNSGEVEFTVRLKNRTDREIKDLRLVMNYPSGTNAFAYTSSEYTVSSTIAPITSPSTGDNTWNLSRLAGGSEQVLKLRGKVTGANGAKLSFGVSIDLKNSRNEYQKIRETFKDISIVAQNINLSIKIEGKDSYQIFAPGETLTFSVNYKNEGTKIINDLIVTSFVDDPASILDLSTLSFTSAERGSIAGNQVVWKAPTLPQLQTVRPTQTGTYNFTVKVKNEANFLNANLDQKQYTLRAGATAKAQNLDQIEASSPSYKAKGKLEFFQDDPVVKKDNAGKEIKTAKNKNIYTVTWRIRSWQNETSDVVVKTTSALDRSSWLGVIVPESAKNSIVYNPQSGEITWSVGTVLGYTGRKDAEIKISFDVEADKSDGPLTKEPQITGTDIFTSEKYDFKGKTTEVK